MRPFDTSSLDMSEQDRAVAIAFMRWQQRPLWDYEQATPFMKLAFDHYDRFGIFPLYEHFAYGYFVISQFYRDQIDFDYYHPHDDAAEVIHNQAIAELALAEQDDCRSITDGLWPNARQWISEMLPDQEFTESFGDYLVDSFTFDDSVSQALWEVYAIGQY